MAILSKGQTFADGDDVTHTKLNNLVDAAAFVSGPTGTTDHYSLEVNGSGRLQIKSGGVYNSRLGTNSVSTAKIANSTSTTDGVTFPKMRYLSDMKVIGNVSGGTTYPSEVSILDEDDMASDSATSLATQQSIKAYVDRNKNITSLTTSQSLSAATSWTDVPGLSITATFSGAVSILASLDVTSVPNWGDKAFRLLINGVAKTTRAYRYVGSAYERDWVFDLPWQETISGSATIKVQYQSAKDLSNEDSGGLVTDVRPWTLMTW